MAIKREAAEEAAKKAEGIGFQPGAEDTFAGFEQIDGSTMAIPFLRVLQSASPQVKKMEDQYVEGAEEGMFFNTITKELYGKELRLIVLRFEHMYVEWMPDRGGFVGVMDPERAAQVATDKTFGKWKRENGNILQETYVYMVLVEGHEKEGPMVLSMASTSIKVAKAWNRLMTTQIMPNGERAKPYYMIWKVTLDYLKNDKGSWYRPKVVFDSYISEEILLLVRNERKVLPSRTVDYKQLEAHPEGSGGEAAAAHGDY